MPGDERLTIGEFFLRSAKSNSSQSFISHVFGYQYTYDDSIQKIATIIQFFQSQGIKKGDRIVCYWEETVPGVLFSLACAISGVVFVPLSPIFSVHYLKNLIAQTGAKAVFTTLDRMPTLQEGDLQPFCSNDFIDSQDTYVSEEKPALPQVSLLEAQKILDELSAEVLPDDIFMIQPTSGSTGQPKLVLRPHISPCRYGKYVGAEIIHDAGERPKFLMVAALTHAFGFNMLTTALSVGAELLVPSRIDASAPLDEVRDLNPTVIPLVPRILRSFFMQSQRAKQLSENGHLFGSAAKYLISAGGAGDPSYFKTVHEQGIEILELYGSSEASLVSMTPRNGWRAGFSGKILPDVELNIQEDGELLIRSPGMMKGYYNDENATLEAFTQDGFYNSGDLGHLDSEGYLEILGRKKDIFNTAEGSNIYPERIENLLEALPSIKQAILVGDRMPFISAMVVLRPESLPLINPPDPRLDFIDEKLYSTLYRKIGLELKQVNSQLERVEQIVRFAIFNKPFHADAYTTVGPGKARRTRPKIRELYGDRIDALYDSSKVINVSFVPGMDRRMRPHSDLRVHLIWLSKDHKSLIRREVGEKIKPILKEMCHNMNVRILSGNIAPNHVHLFISYPPELSVAEIVSQLKRVTSTKVFHALPNVQEEAMGKNLWDQGYLAVTSGILDNDIIDRYIVSEDKELATPLLPAVEETSIVIPLSDLGM